MTLEDITTDKVYQEVLRDSFGGVMYSVANRDKYDSEHLLAKWDDLTPVQRESAGGIMRGAINFLKETKV